MEWRQLCQAVKHRGVLFVRDVGRGRDRGRKNLQTRPPHYAKCLITELILVRLVTIRQCSLWCIRLRLSLVGPRRLRPAGPLLLSLDVQPVVRLYVAGLLIRLKVNARQVGEALFVAWTERNTSQRGAPVSRPGHRLDGKAREALIDELSRHPSVLGRLVSIAGLWDEQAGVYRHKLAAHYGSEEIHRMIRRLHQEVFVSWLSLPLRQQQADVAIYLSALGLKPEWFDFRKMGMSCVPQTATLPERDLFLLDLALIQGLTRY